MKFYFINTKNLPVVLLMLLAALILTIASLGCSSMSTIKRGIITYQATGAILEEAKPAILTGCVNGTLDEADCADAKKAYNQAVTVYKDLGDATTLAIFTGDNAPVSRLTLQLQNLLIVVNKYLVTQ